MQWVTGYLRHVALIRRDENNARISSKHAIVSGMNDEYYRTDVKSFMTDSD